MNLATIIEPHDADKVALIDRGETITYGRLRDAVGALRRVLVDQGFGPDDRLMIAAGNEPLFVVAALATLGIGAVAVPIKPTSPMPEFEGKLAAVGPAALLVGESAEWLLERASDVAVPVIDLATVPSTTESAPAIVTRGDDDDAFYLLTSGVAGESKVAMLSHHNLRWVQEALDEGEKGLRPDDVTLGALPFAHIFGLNVVLLATLRIGGTIVLQRRFDVDESLELVREHGVTLLTGAPPMWQRWAVADAPDTSLATVRNASSGAAALPITAYEAIRDRYGVEVGQGYGLTETSPVVTTSREVPVKPASVGVPLEGVDLVLVDTDGTPVEIGDAGEVVVRSPGVFKGYLDDPETTAAVLTEDGWFWTGDVGVVDDDGYLFLVDRVKDLIIVSGFNVYPAEVENVLLRHPDVRGAVVVGGPHGDTGETVIAHVSGDVDEADLDAFARANLSRYKCPTIYHFVDELPVAPTGKLVRRELR